MEIFQLIFKLRQNLISKTAPEPHLKNCDRTFLKNTAPEPHLKKLRQNLISKILCQNLISNNCARTLSRKNCAITASQTTASEPHLKKTAPEPHLKTTAPEPWNFLQHWFGALVGCGRALRRFGKTKLRPYRYHIYYSPERRIKWSNF